MKIVLAGDFVPFDRIVPILDREDFGQIFDSVIPVIKDADYSVVNFECPVVDGEQDRIEKAGPCLKCSVRAVEAIKYAGFKCATLANNHFRDYGDEGCMNTIKELEKDEIDHVGGGKNLVESQKILYKEIDDLKVAFVNFCEHEFSIATGSRAGSAPLDMVDSCRLIKEAKAQADYVLVIVHGGHEYYQLPSPRMKKTYRWFTEIGADAVVNHHQHCYSGYEVYDNKPIFYGLGNFCFDGNRSGGKDMWYEGYMVEIQFSGRNEESKVPEFRLIPYIQCKENPTIVIMTGASEKRFYCNMENLNATIQDDYKLEAEFDKWCYKKSDIMELMLTPYTQRLFTGLWRRHLLPSFLPKSRVLQLRNMTECESHRDTFYAFLNKNSNVR